MKRLFYLFTLCFTILATLNIGAIIVGRNSLELKLVPELKICVSESSSLCYLEIKPGKTSSDYIQSLRSEPYLVFSDVSSDFASRRLPPHYSIRFNSSIPDAINPSAAFISSIDLSIKENSIDVGTVVAIVGYPCAVTLLDQQIALTYSHMSIYVLPVKDRLSFASPIKYISLRDSTINFCDLLPEDITHYEWHGFRKY